MSDRDDDGERVINPSPQKRSSKTGVVAFVLLSFAIAWAAWGVCWVIAARGVGHDGLTPIVILGSFGPFFAAGIAAEVQNGHGAAIALYRRAFEWRIGWLVFLLSLLSVPMLSLVTAGLFEGRFPALAVPVAELPKMYLWLLFLGGPVGEEFGWSYLSDQLDERLSLATEITLVGLIWALWHLPLFFLNIPGLSQKFVPFTAFLTMSLAMRALFAWAYHRGHRSILSNLLMHNGLNVGFSLVLIVVPTTASNQPRLWCLSALAAAAAGALWWFLPARSRREAQSARP